MNYAVKNETLHSVSMEFPKPNYNLRFHNKDGEEIATLDFNGPGLAFEGIADEAAITFVDWIAQVFKQRLDEEYQRGFNEGKKHETNT